MVDSLPVLVDKWVDGKESSLWAGQNLHGLRQCVLGEPFEWNSFLSQIFRYGSTEAAGIRFRISKWIAEPQFYCSEYGISKVLGEMG